MSDNKFIQRLKGKQTPKSVVEVQNDKQVAPFTGVPYSTDVVGAIVDDKDSSIVVAKGAQNWKLDGNSLVATSSLSGDGADYTGEFNASGSGLWINATYSLPDTIFNAGTKWVLKLCGKNLLTTSGETIGFTLVVKVGNTHITSKTFTVAEGANVFCRQLAIDFSESEQAVIKARSGDNLTVQLLCSDANASATIYNGMTVLTALQRRVDGDAVFSDKYTFDELAEDLATHIANKNNPHQVTKAQVGLGNCDNTSDLDKPISTATQTALDGKVSKTGDTMTGALKFKGGTSYPELNIFQRGSTNEIRFWASNYTNYSITMDLQQAALVPLATGRGHVGTSSLYWADAYINKVYTATLNNGANLTVPATAGTIATTADVELAAQSGTQLYSTGVWYAKMSAETVPPASAEVVGRNYADFSGETIDIYEYTISGWDLVDSIKLPEYNGYITVTSKIWDIPEQSGQQGGRVLWNHTSKKFTPYPLIISFEDINVTGNSTVDMPQNPGANQIVNKDYVDEAIASIPTPTVDVKQSIDAEIVGTLTQSGSVFSGFSSANYLRLPWVTYLTSPFEFVIGANFTAGTLKQIVAYTKNAVNGLFELSYNSATNEITFVGGGGGVQISGIVSNNTDYLIKVSWDGSQYKLFTSTNNGETYTQVGSTVSSTAHCGYGSMVFGIDPANQYYEAFLGSIDFSKAYLKVGENIVWSGMDSPGLQHRVLKGHEVIEFQAPTASNNYTWYRKYADGWVEQGGLSTKEVSISLPVTMSDTNYTATAAFNTTANDYISYTICVASKTTTTILLKCQSNVVSNEAAWRVEGMAA